MFVSQRFLTLCLCTLTLAACGGGDTSTSAPQPPMPPPGDPGAAKLTRISGPVELEATLEAGLTAQQGQLAAAVAASGAPPPEPAGFSGTYTQEVSVDEFDSVRYDGTYLYIAPRRFSCCFIQAGDTSGGTPIPGEPEASIRILSTDADAGTADLVATIPLEPAVSVQGMYMDDASLFALTSDGVYGSYGPFWGELAIWAPPQMGFRVYDVSDPTAPALSFDATIDGVFIESRRIGDTVYIVSRFVPNVEDLIYGVTTPQQQAHNQMVLDNVGLDELLPQIAINGNVTTLVDPNQCYAATTTQSPGLAVITSITAVPVSDPAAYSTTCYTGEAYGVYVSASAMYLAESRHAVADNSVATRIHKFLLSDNVPDYAGSAEVAGTVWRGGQADFRMSESDGDLRLLASQYDDSAGDFVDHTLYVLRESSTADELDIVSQLPNDNRPEEIGKPDEDLYGVRFLGDRAYAVTFEVIDPLYVIDLSDPADPKLAGELEVTGFSDFLHPVTDELLLGLGQSAGGGIKLELFDVSVIEQPLSRGGAILGGPGSYSEARYDRHAFTYLPGMDGTDRFAIPAFLLAEDGSYTLVESGLYLFEIHDKLAPTLATLAAVGSIQAGGGDVVSVFERSRAFIHDQTVFYVRNEAVWVAPWNSPDIVNGPF